MDWRDTRLTFFRGFPNLTLTLADFTVVDIDRFEGDMRPAADSASRPGLHRTPDPGTAADPFPGAPIDPPQR